MCGPPSRFLSDLGVSDLGHKGSHGSVGIDRRKGHGLCQMPPRSSGSSLGSVPIGTVWSWSGEQLYNLFDSIDITVFG